MADLRLFTPTINSDNRFDLTNISNDATDEVVIGGSVTNVFKFPFRYSKIAKSGIIYYKQGLDIILEIPITEDMIKEDEDLSITLIFVTLSPLQTQLFKTSLLNSFAQARFIFKDDTVQYGDEHKLHVITPLKVEKTVGDIKNE